MTTVDLRGVADFLAGNRRAMRRIADAIRKDPVVAASPQLDIIEVGLTKMVAGSVTFDLMVRVIEKVTGAEVVLS